MGGLFKQTDADGNVTYSDRPISTSSQESLLPSGQRPNAEGKDQKTAHEEAVSYIKEAQKRIPKVVDYLDYLEYLRHNSPLKFDRVMQELRKQDPQTWLKLQKYPQFRPLRETAVGIKAGSNLMGTGLGFATGNFTGSTEKWMEATLKDLMKRDRFGPYADVLGAKATTLPTKPSTYSNSRLGQYLKQDEALTAAGAKAAVKELETARAGLRAAKGVAVTRVFGPLVDLGIGMLDPEMGQASAAILVEAKLMAAYRNGTLDEEQYTTAHNLMASGRFKEMSDYLKSVKSGDR